MDSPAPALWDRWEAAEFPEPPPAKKLRSSTEVAVGSGEVTCQVEGCGAGLGSAKEYHRKHRVCEAHSKCPRVSIAGQERRFCQQCSRFHALSEFDRQKRSCRRRLSDHNARRRKPQPESFMFGSKCSSLFYGGAKEISFVWDQNSYDDGSYVASSLWNDHSSLKPSKVKGLQLKASNTEICNDELQLGRSEQQNAFSSLFNDPQEIVQIKGMEASFAAASTMHEAPDLQSAFSLLSSSSPGVSPDLVPTSSVIQLPDVVSIGEIPVILHPCGANPSLYSSGWRSLAPPAPAAPPSFQQTNSTQVQGCQVIHPGYNNTSLFG